MAGPGVVAGEHPVLEGRRGGRTSLEYAVWPQVSNHDATLLLDLLLDAKSGSRMWITWATLSYCVQYLGPLLQSIRSWAFGGRDFVETMRVHEINADEKPPAVHPNCRWHCSQ